MISVVIASDRAGSELARCLDSLHQQSSAEEFETLVACTCAEAGCSLGGRYPEVRFLQFDEWLSKPQLLQRALKQARGEIIVVTEPYCFFPADWLQNMRHAHERDFAVIGGAVEYGGPNTVVEWACYLADYGPFTLPSKSRVTNLLAGNHISYKRAALDQAAEAWRDEYAKVFVLWELERQGVRFFFDSELVIWCAQEIGFSGFAASYYRNATEFAATRARSLPPLARLAHILTAPALPALLLFRRVCAVWGNKRHRLRVLKAIPVLAVFMLCWSAGELRGYLRSGRP